MDLLPPSPCALCPRRHSPILEPIRPARICLLSEKPAKQELRRGYPFAGETGTELDQNYLPSAGLCRPDIYVTNTIKCLTTGDPSPDLISCCSSHWLPYELRRVSPTHIITAGAIAAHLFSPSLSLFLDHGRPFHGSLTDQHTVYWEGEVMPVFHPAAGFHAQEFQIPIQEDFQAVRRWLKGELVLPVDEYPEPDYKLVEAGQVVEDFTIAMDRHRGELGYCMAVDTEYELETGKPMCLSYSLWPGMGRLVLASDQEALDVFKTAYKSTWWIHRQRIPVVFHNWLADVPVLGRMGWTYGTDYTLTEDTMMDAYHLQTYPQSLKVLGHRLMGVHMEEFEDVVKPYHDKIVVAWLESITRTVYPSPGPRRRRLDQLAAKALDDYFTNPVMSVKERWDGWEEDVQQQAIDSVGGFPLPSPFMIPLEVLTPYACKDADITRRLRYLLRAARKMAFRDSR